jgi:hypothetical protein
MANVAMILFEEHDGAHATSHFAIVLGANLPWGLLPVAVIIRLARDHPFTAARSIAAASDATSAVVPTAPTQPTGPTAEATA